MELCTFSELGWSWSYAHIQRRINHGVIHIFRAGLVMELCTFSKQGWSWNCAHFQSRVGHGVMHIFRAGLIMELYTFSEVGWSWSYAHFQSCVGPGVTHIFKAGLIMELYTFSELEAEASLPQERRLKLSEPDVAFCISMMEKYGDDYKVRVSSWNWCNFVLVVVWELKVGQGYNQ